MTSVYDSYTISAVKLSQDLLDFLVDATVEDLNGLGPTGVFAFIQEHGCLNLGDFKDAQDADTAGARLPTMTPAKRKKDLESPNGTFSTLTDAVSLLKEEVCATLGYVETLGIGSSVGSRAQEASDNGDGNAVEIALEDLQTRVDHLTSLSVMTGESLGTFAETVVETRVEDDSIQIRQVNYILALETSLGRQDWSESEVPANVWQAIHDLQEEMSRKATERDLEDVLEFVQEGTGSGPGQGTAVQFRTPIRPSPDTYMDSSNPIQLGGGTMEVDPRSNQDSNPSGQDATSDPSQLREEIKVLRKLLNELCDKVFGAGGSGYTFEGRPICSQLDIEALLEKELPRKYIPVSCFVCPYILLDFVFDTFMMNCH